MVHYGDTRAIDCVFMSREQCAVGDGTRGFGSQCIKNPYYNGYRIQAGLELCAGDHPLLHASGRNGAISFRTAAPGVEEGYEVIGTVDDETDPLQLASLAVPTSSAERRLTVVRRVVSPMTEIRPTACLSFLLLTRCCSISVTEPSYRALSDVCPRWI
jgi:hypothetical protein